ncbi:MAG: hypothetical protein PUK22_01565 [Bacteroides sp.]|nr:hypothetical protein [Bacteroides sp.]
MKRFLSILALGLVFLSSCLSELQGDRDDVSGPSNIVLKISTKAQTKGGASDGDVMSNLHLWLVYNNSVERYLSQDDADCTISGSTATATFSDVPRGACTIYLVANLPEGNPLPKTYAVGKSIDEDFLKYVLPEVVNYEPPFGDSTPGMPLSTSVSLSVGAGTNRVSAELVRTCAKLSITVRNNTTNNTIILKDLILTNKNPNVGYLFEQSDYSIPDAVSFGPFMSTTHSSGETVSDVIPQGSERTYIQQYMYETATNGAADLGFEIVGGLFPKGTESAQLKTHELVGDNPVSSINSGLNENEYYLIKNSVSDYFLYYDSVNKQLKATKIALSSLLQMNDNDLKPYKWKISTNGTSISEIVNGSSINISTTGAISLTNGGTVKSAGYSTKGGFRFYNGSVVKGAGWFDYDVNTYTLQVTESGEVKTYPNKQSVYFYPLELSDYVAEEKSCYFQLYKVKFVEESETKLVGPDGTLADVYFDKTISSLNYINKYGTPVPLEQIRRNQDVKIVVNIHYNPNSGVLYFETTDWVKDNNETTFD